MWSDDQPCTHAEHPQLIASRLAHDIKQSGPICACSTKPSQRQRSAPRSLHISLSENMVNCSQLDLTQWCQTLAVQHHTHFLSKVGDQPLPVAILASRRQHKTFVKTEASKECVNQATSLVGLAGTQSRPTAHQPHVTAPHALACPVQYLSCLRSMFRCSSTFGGAALAGIVSTQR